MTSITDPTNPFIITTDAADYAPGTTATITASNLDAGGSVTFDVDHVLSDGTLADDLSGTGIKWTIVDGGAGDLDGLVNGSIVTSWNVGLDALNQSFLLSGVNLVTGVTATATFTDANPVPPTYAVPLTGSAVKDLTASGTQATINGALFASNFFANVSGSGTFPSFVQVGGNGDTEQGYNYNAATLTAQFQEGNSATHNHPVLLGNISILTENFGSGDHLYYLFALDSNEPNSLTRLISLDALQIFSANSPSLTNFDPPVLQGGTGGLFGANATLRYNMDAGSDSTVYIDSTVGSGSGKPDLAVFVPVGDFAGLDPATTYLYLYSAFGQQGGAYVANSGFEEWSTAVGNTAVVNAKINIVKMTTDNTHAAGPGDGIPAVVGDSLTWTYTVTNPGNVALSNVTVTDDNGTPGNTADDFLASPVLSGGFNIGDTNHDNKLDTTETWTFTAPGTATTIGTYTNVGTATGTYIDLTVQATDPSGYFGSRPDIHATGEKYQDFNGDGHINGADGPLTGWVINLYNDVNTDGLLDSGDTLNTTITTGASGTFTFGPLANGKYVLVEANQSGWVASPDADTTLVNPVDGFHDTESQYGYAFGVTASSSSDVTGLDFANFELFSISGTKYNDLTGNGITADDGKLAGVTINLYDDNSGTDTLLASTTTDANGHYEFDNLGPLAAGHKYLVKEVLPSGDTQTVGQSGYLISSVSGGNDTSHNDSGNDFANFVNEKIEGTKYTDITGNGITADDTVLAGITINLYDDNSGTDTLLASTTTDASGHYEFDNLGPLAAGHKYLVKEVLPSGDTETVGTSGYLISPTSGADATGNNFANFVNEKIEGTKYTDITGNGITADDTVLAGITINLYDDNGGTDTLLASTTTNASGHYEFDNLGPLAAGHKYLVKEVLPSGDTETVGTSGYLISPTSGGDATGNNFANFVNEKIEGTKYTDITGNGITADDTVLAGITINLYDDNSGTDTLLASTTTNASGHYEFDNLGPLAAGHKYLVKEVLPSGDTETVGTSGYLISPTSSADATGNNFANFVNEKIEGTKYNDLTGNGITADDTVLAGITIQLYDDLNGTDTLLSSTTTNASGHYEFDNLGPLAAGHKYLVKEVLPSGDTQTVGQSGYLISSVSGSDSTGNDFANFQPLKIEGTKYEDKTGNGITADDGKLAGVTINLYDDNSGTDTLLASTTTNASGHYEFDNLGLLAAGHKYLVKEVLPSGDTQTVGQSGYLIDAVGGTDNTGNNFANFVNEKIEGTKYTDITGNGITADDTVLAGITIQLYDDLNGTDTLLSSTTTNASGHYEFDNLGPLAAGHKYLVKEVLPSGDTETVGNSGYLISPTSGADAAGNNFGNFVNFNISGYKFLDANANGVWDSGETGILNWTINLDNDTNPGNGVIASTTTDATGHYEFDNLGPGHYYVYETQQAGWTNSYNGATNFIAQSGVNHSGHFGVTEVLNFGNVQATPDTRELTQGFWGSHSDVWDNIAGNEGNPSKAALKGGVISSLDVNPRTDGYLLLGDGNGNGIADDSHDLLITITLAKAIESSSTTGDARLIMLQQAIAVQLNIDNMIGFAVPGYEPNDLIDEAVMWLTNKGIWGSQGAGVNVDANNDGIIDTNLAGTGLAGTAVKTSSAAWTKYVDVTDPSTGIPDWNGGAEANGSGLHSALEAFNTAHLTTSLGGGTYVMYDGQHTHFNTLDQFWVVLHEQGGITGIHS